jgi:hypothetical protein
MLRAAPLQPLYDAPAASASRRRAIGLALSDAPKTGQSGVQYPELARGASASACGDGGGWGGSARAGGCAL